MTSITLKVNGAEIQASVAGTLTSGMVGIPVTIEYLDNNKIRVNYPSLCRAVTPGQAVVIYDGEICLGGAIIDEVYYNDERRKY